MQDHRARRWPHPSSGPSGHILVHPSESWSVSPGARGGEGSQEPHLRKTPGGPRAPPRGQLQVRKPRPHPAEGSRPASHLLSSSAACPGRTPRSWGWPPRSSLKTCQPALFHTLQWLAAAALSPWPTPPAASHHKTGRVGITIHKGLLMVVGNISLLHLCTQNTLSPCSRPNGAGRCLWRGPGPGARPTGTQSFLLDMEAQEHSRCTEAWDFTPSRLLTRGAGAGGHSSELCPGEHSPPCPCLLLVGGTPQHSRPPPHPGIFPGRRTEAWHRTSCSANVQD